MHDRPLVACLLVCALAGACPTVDVGEAPIAPDRCRPDPLAFRDPGGIWDTALAPADTSRSCVAQGGCHDAANGRSLMRFVVKPRSSMTQADWEANYDETTEQLNCMAPSDSPLITRPLVGRDPHPVDVWTCEPGSCEPIMTVERWIAGE